MAGLLTKEGPPNEDKDDPNKHLDFSDGAFYTNITDIQKLVDSDGSDSEKRHSHIRNVAKTYADSPQNHLSKFIPSSPFKINGNLRESKVGVRSSSLTNSNDRLHLLISIESSDHEEENEVIFSKSCDASMEVVPSLVTNHKASMSRSMSQDLIPNVSMLHRKISVVSSSKGKLVGVPRVLPGEKMIRASSMASVSVREKQKKEETKPTFTREKKILVFCLCIVDFTAYLSMSIIAPFFPREASNKGMREAVAGMVFSIYALIIMATAPIFGKLLPYVGSKFMFLAGVGFCGVCNILFGLLDNVNGQIEFSTLCFIVRSFEALGAAAFCTASCTILIGEFPDDIGYVFGLTETCIGVGMSIGPAIGGALYSLGGFGLPFFTLGGFVVLIVPLCWYLMRNMKEPTVLKVGNSASYKKLLSMPHVIVVCLILVSASQAQGFIDPTLEPHMRQYNLDTGIVGLLFLLLSACYAVSSPIVGWVSGKVENKYPIMIFGLLLATASMALLGPSHVLPIEGSLWLSIVALALMGVAFAVAYVPTFEGIFIAAMNGGLEDEVNTYAVVSGLWNSMYSLGEVTGPTLGGVLSDFFTFPEASSCIALFTLAAFFIALLAWFNPCQCFGPFSLVEDAEEKQLSAQENNNRIPSRENTPLHDNQVHSYGSLNENKKDPMV